MLLAALPPESQTATAMRLDGEKEREERAGRGEEEPPAVAPKDPADYPWSATNMLLGTLIDEIRVQRWLYVSAHSKTKPPLPQQVRRPGVSKKDARRHRSRLTAEQRRMLDPRLREQEAVSPQSPEG